jgi:outer membrane protein TolC
VTRTSLAAAAAILTIASTNAPAQTAPAPQAPAPSLQFQHPAGPSAPPVMITLRDALERARQNDVQFQASTTEAEVAAAEARQASAARFPAFSHTTQYLGTQGNGTTPNGRFVTNDGVHVYRSWMVAHQELSANTLGGAAVNHARAAEALARAKLEVSQRGLVVTVTRAYYTLAAGQRRYAAAQDAAAQAQRFFEITQQLERLGQAAHADVVKAQITLLQQQQAFQETLLVLENARLDLAVLLGPTINENFTVVDDLDATQTVPSFDEVQMRAERDNPDLRAAAAALRVAAADVTTARNAFLPNLMLDGVYGIEANAFALHSINQAFPEKGLLPNLGYFITANLTVPLWDWGGNQARLAQAAVKRRQASVELTQAQKQLVRNLYASYNEAIAARAAVENTRQAAALADESLRLTVLRYQAGESTAQEVVDAQNTLSQSRSAYADALVRDHVAVATLQTVTGSF